MEESDSQVVIFSLQDTYYGIDITYVAGIIKPQFVTIVPNTPDFIDGVINLRGKIVVVIDLNSRIGNSASYITDDSRIIILEVDGDQIGLRVFRNADPIEGHQGPKAGRDNRTGARQTDAVRYIGMIPQGEILTMQIDMVFGAILIKPLHRRF